MEKKTSISFQNKETKYEPTSYGDLDHPYQWL